MSPDSFALTRNRVQAGEVAETHSIPADRTGRDSLQPNPSAPSDDAVTVTELGPEGTLELALSGMLDQRAGERLLEILHRGVVDGAKRVTIDLRHLEGLTEEGTAALGECRALGTRFPEGLHYRSDSGPSRAALLVALGDSPMNSPEDSDLA